MLLDRRLRQVKNASDSRIAPAGAHLSQYVEFARRQLAERGGGPRSASGDECLDDFGVDQRAPGTGFTQGTDKLLRLGHPVFQQVREARHTVLEQLESVRLVGMVDRMTTPTSVLAMDLARRLNALHPVAGLGMRISEMTASGGSRLTASSKLAASATAATTSLRISPSPAGYPRGPGSCPRRLRLRSRSVTASNSNLQNCDEVRAEAGRRLNRQASQSLTLSRRPRSPETGVSARLKPRSSSRPQAADGRRLRLA